VTHYTQMYAFVLIMCVSLHIICKCSHLRELMCNCDVLYTNYSICVNNTSKCVNYKNMHRIFYYLRIMQHKVALFYISIHNPWRIMYLTLSQCESVYYFVLWRFRCCASIIIRTAYYYSSYATSCLEIVHPIHLYEII